MITNITDLKKIKENYLAKMGKYEYSAMICYGTGCVASNCEEVRNVLVEELEKHGLTEKVAVVERGCMGTCAVGPVVYVLPDETYYTEIDGKKIRDIVTKHFIGKQPVEEYTFYDSIKRKRMTNINEVSFFKDQVRIALRNCGLIDVTCIDSYIAKDGYLALVQTLEKGDRYHVIDVLKKSGLRGRGGGGFPAGVKWEAGYNAPEGQKYIICNADEGDPGAFMDRSVFEGDPHSVIEGMMLGGYAIGASRGVVYIRAEYPIAIQRLEAAIEAARAEGLLGKNIMGSGFDFDMEIRIGAGAFVCGEETALMASVEGRRGEPWQKPPFPFQKGLFGRPSIINNVETFANVPPILLNGAEWFQQFGTPESPGTKVFALTGNIINTGLVEIPMGMSLGEVVYSIGGGIPNDKKFKSAQTGGPSGGCITPSSINTPLEYDSLLRLGTMIGSGGLIIMDEDTCMVDTARFYMDFICEESCGKCTACRMGTKRMLEILERITKGKGEPEDIDRLIALGETIQQTAMCGLGQTAPNPVLSTIKNFREEYDEHIHKKYCRAGVCSELFTSPCENACPASINVPGYLSLIALGRHKDAYRLIHQENPFPAACGRVCTHPCEAKCRRAQLDEAIAICSLKRFATDYAFKQDAALIDDNVAPPKGISVGIIGAGPSGLTCGFYLARLGYEVHVYEGESVAGGVLAYGIPEYRLPKKVLAEEIKVIEKQGVQIHLNTKVGVDVTLAELKEKHKAIYIAAGTQISNRLDIPGEDMEGVCHGLDYLRKVNLGQEAPFGKVVAVIGGGNTAIDAARVARRRGAEKVYIVYRRAIEDMPANKMEIEEAVEEGIEIIPLMAPVSFLGEQKVNGILCDRMELKGFDAAGRRRPKETGEQVTIDVDLVIAAVSQSADLSFVAKDEIKLTRWDTFAVNDDTMETSVPGIFAGGDVARGADTAIQAIADGKKAAQHIAIYLGDTGELNKGRPIDIPDMPADEDEVAEHCRFGMEILPPEQRIKNFDEVVQGYHKLSAVAESMRCLHCDRR